MNVPPDAVFRSHAQLITRKDPRGFRFEGPEELIRRLVIRAKQDGLTYYTQFKNVTIVVTPNDDTRTLIIRYYQERNRSLLSEEHVVDYE